MEHLEVPRYLALLTAMLLLDRLLGAAAQKLGQTSVLGELLAGVILGSSALAWVDPHDPILHFLAELGVILLLCEIGLETDLA